MGNRTWETGNRKIGKRKGERGKGKGEMKAIQVPALLFEASVEISAIAEAVRLL